MTKKVFLLDRAITITDLEVPRKDVADFLRSVEEPRVEATVQRIPDDTQKALVEKIGTNNGQVLAPIKEMIDSASRLTAEKVKEVRTLLTQEIDPEKETST